ncbi:hypothetical protein [Actinoplanes sp. NPDC049118]|uniref:hypothetical protein n=1 Tax=Actinoplanes sp. NPDC049118 TaxID=3155769 RepID=UPI0033F36057
MSEPRLTLPERAFLLILLAENEELSNKDIRERYADSVTLTGKARVKLIEAKFIECRKGERNAFFFTLADDGWRWCREELSRAVPPKAGSIGQALYAVLGGLGRYLDRTDRSLAQVFGNEPEFMRGTGAETAGDPPARAVTADQTADQIELEIRRAYRRLADPVGSWIGLADIREELGDIPGREVDGVLRLMVRIPGIRIEEETNQKALTQRDRDAAVVIGQRAQHVLAIEAP